MPIALMICLATLAWAAADAENAVARLSSSKAAERATALAEIERLGEAALPALAVAANSRDLMLRAQAAALMDSIEGRRLIRPTLVALDFRDLPLASAVDSISQRSGMTLVLDPENDPRWKTKSVTIQAPQPVPLWDALDRLAKAGGLRLDPPANPWMRQRQVFFNAQGQRRRLSSGNELIFRPDDGAVPAPTSDSGAFRVSIVGIRLNRNRSFIRTLETIGQPAATSQFTAQFMVRSEPRLTLASLDQPRLDEAVDDLGQSLLSSEPSPVVVNLNRGFDENLMRVTPIILSLKYPESPGRTITRLRGSVRALVVGRRPDPLVFPLAGSIGKTFGAEGISIQLHQIRQAQDGRETSVELTLNMPGGLGMNPGMHNLSDPRSVLRPPPSARGQIDFLDTKGRLCQTIDLGLVGMGYASSGRTSLTIQPPEGVGPPVEARYFAATWASILVPFEFHNIPMP
ncbi:MAG: hypothetical protein JWN86_2954 [Planctomycetota bacterium]|nr:hypothetical protein [Planctomycetota bacterium]